MAYGIESFAQGIAMAEGFFVDGSRPQRNNNPGDLTVDVTGAGVGMDGPFVVYGTAADGWTALQTEVRKMFDGTSRYYNPSMTIAQVAAIWTTTTSQQAAWAKTVANAVGATVDTTLSDLQAAWESDPGTVAGIGGSLLLLVALVAFVVFRKGV